MPEGAVYVGRPGVFGNPYRVGGEIPGTGGDTYDAESATAMFRLSARTFWGGEGWREEVRAELAGRDLACWCPLDQPCHADVLLEIANGGEARP